MNIIEKLFAKTKSFAITRDKKIFVTLKGSGDEVAAIMLSCANNLVRSGEFYKENIIAMIEEMVKEGYEE